MTRFGDIAANGDMAANRCITAYAGMELSLNPVNTLVHMANNTPAHMANDDKVANNSMELRSS